MKSKTFLTFAVVIVAAALSAAILSSWKKTPEATQEEIAKDAEVADTASVPDVEPKSLPVGDRQAVTQSPEPTSVELVAKEAPIPVFSAADPNHPKYYEAIAEAQNRVRRENEDILRYTVVSVNWDELLSLTNAGDTDTRPMAIPLFDGMSCTIEKKRILRSAESTWTVSGQCNENPNYPSARIIIEPDIPGLFADFNIDGSRYAIRAISDEFAVLVEVNPARRTRTHD